MTSPRLLCLLACPLALVAACTSADSVNMIPSDLTVTRRHAGSVQITATGTAKRMGIGAARVSGARLEDALRAALLEAGVFEAVAEDGADYSLAVRVESLSNPEASLRMRVDATLVWSLSDDGGGRTLFESPIRTSYTATSQDAFDVQDREQFAIERALQENLREGISRLAELDLPTRG